MVKIIQRIKITESAKNGLESIKGVCKVISLDSRDIQKIKKLETLDEQMGCKMIGRKYNVGIKKVLSSDVVLSFMVNKEYEWPESTIKLFHKGKMIGEDTQDQTIIHKFNECNNSFVMGNIIFYDKEALRKSDIDDPIYMIVTEQPCPQLDPLWGISGAVIGIPSSYTHDYLQLKISADQKQMLGSFLVGFNIDKRTPTPFLIDDDQIDMDIKDRKCQLPL
ncbi:hypothetical protein [uncultured Methanomethylovorans sp.]|uniref:hypothetical protein n=1 Tax=uncultured Methanomethylovorans sp. TaxID=183759 RepID=UPI002AA7857D|nr:hypothetical protein [uncultured Methanomethylovorans sp.]